ncbi:hypothetical protein [Pedobacter jamesrossensis]|uniref:Uncharacterized protein n=1 Tax=Pedobacter jamesrossensis TaxID=1908238 RepID=A0ABV8NKE9_9SPHI
MKQPKITLNHKTVFIYKSVKTAVKSFPSNPTDPTTTTATVTTSGILLR